MTDVIRHGVPPSLSERYAVGRRLGHGGMATVYQATDRLLQREVAIKVFTARADSAAEVERQAAEARLLASLNHHALTTLLDAGVDTSDQEHPQIYLVMEYIPGDDLRERLLGGPIDSLQVCWLGFDLCEGLEFVHANGVLHRDIKPANVLLASRTAETRLRGKLADFGVASLRGVVDVEEYVQGTAAYLSPEQAAGEQATAVSDIYSLGLVLLEALTGEVAFPGNVVESAMARLDRDPAISARIPEVIAAVLRRMTARRSQDRISLIEAAAAFRNVIYDDHILRRAPTGPSPAEVEDARAAASRRYDLLGTAQEETFDRVTRIASRVLAVPIAVITLAAADRVWITSRQGLEFSDADRHTVPWSSTGPGQRDPWTVPDAETDPRTRNDPLVLGVPMVRSYAAAPLVTEDDQRIGALGVFDREPRVFTGRELETLKDLADIVMHEMALLLAVRSALFAR